MSQKDFSGHSAAKLMDQFDVFCMFTGLDHPGSLANTV
jgi:hypothetical protein